MHITRNTRRIISGTFAAATMMSAPTLAATAVEAPGGSSVAASESVSTRASGWLPCLERYGVPMTADTSKIEFKQINYAAECRGRYYSYQFSHSEWVSAKTQCYYWDLTVVGGCALGSTNDAHRLCHTFRTPGTAVHEEDVSTYFGAVSR